MIGGTVLTIQRVIPDADLDFTTLIPSARDSLTTNALPSANSTATAAQGEPQRQDSLGMNSLSGSLSPEHGLLQEHRNLLIALIVMVFGAGILFFRKLWHAPGQASLRFF